MRWHKHRRNSLSLGSFGLIISAEQGIPSSSSSADVQNLGRDGFLICFSHCEPMVSDLGLQCRRSRQHAAVFAPTPGKSYPMRSHTMHSRFDSMHNRLLEPAA